MCRVFWPRFSPSALTLITAVVGNASSLKVSLCVSHRGVGAIQYSRSAVFRMASQELLAMKNPSTMTSMCTRVLGEEDFTRTRNVPWGSQRIPLAPGLGGTAAVERITEGKT